MLTWLGYVTLGWLALSASATFVWVILVEVWRWKQRRHQPNSPQLSKTC